jgi:hypothetical protein
MPKFRRDHKLRKYGKISTSTLLMTIKLVRVARIADTKKII